MSKKTWEAIEGRPNNIGFRIFEGGQYIGFIGDSDQKTDAKANARLIAAAPELLEALQKMVKMASTGMVDFNPHDEFVMSSARAVIAKALGEDK